MTRFLIPAAAVLAVASTTLRADMSHWTWADRPFDGSWVTQPERTTFDSVMRAPTFDLDRGLFRRSDCRLGRIEVPADGKNHEIKDQPLFDAMSVRVVDARRVEIIETSAENKVWRGLYTVSANGRAMTLDYEDDRAAEPVTGVLTYSREGDAVSGPHPLSGIWRPDRLTRLSASGRTLTITTQPKTGAPDASTESDPNLGFSLVASDGRSADGKFDMHAYPLRGYLQGSSVALSRLRPDTLQINRAVNGEQVELSRATVSDDGQTMTLAQIDWVCQAKTVFTLQKQSTR